MLDGNHDDSDSTYRAWTTCTAGDVTGFDLVPTLASDEPEQDIPYLQMISCQYHRRGGQLSILCYGMGCSIFLEGTRLKELKRAISERRIRAIHAFDETRHYPPEHGEPVITNMEIRFASQT